MERVFVPPSFLQPLDRRQVYLRITELGRYVEALMIAKYRELNVTTIRSSTEYSLTYFKFFYAASNFFNYT